MPHTPGGTAALSNDLRAGLKIPVGDEKYLWLLVALEALMLLFLRGVFKRHHGG